MLCGLQACTESQDGCVAAWQCTVAARHCAGIGAACFSVDIHPPCTLVRMAKEHGSSCLVRSLTCIAAYWHLLLVAGQQQGLAFQMLTAGRATSLWCVLVLLHALLGWAVACSAGL